MILHYQCCQNLLKMNDFSQLSSKKTIIHTDIEEILSQAKAFDWIHMRYLFDVGNTRLCIFAPIGSYIDRPVDINCCSKMMMTKSLKNLRKSFVNVCIMDILNIRSVSLP